MLQADKNQLSYEHSSALMARSKNLSYIIIFSM